MDTDADSRFLVKNSYLLFLMIGIVLLAGTTMGSNSFENSRMVLYYELAFITTYILLLRPDPGVLQWALSHKTVVALGAVLFTAIILFHYYLSLKALLYLSLALYVSICHHAYLAKLAKRHWLPFLILSAWLILVTFSYYLSPYNVSSHFLGRERYEQTLVHTLLFLIAWDFFRQNHKAILPILLAISFSAAAVGAGSTYLYLIEDPRSLNSHEWFAHPPFGAHMRHIGYQVTAGLAILLPMLAFKAKQKFGEWAIIVLTILLWAFLFWTGGRSAIASIVLTTALLIIYFSYKHLPLQRFLLFSLATATVGLILSELLHVFPWNGLGQAIWRVASAEDMQKLTTGRTQIWLNSWAAVKDHLLLGLGPQGFFFTPDRFGIAIQPHSMFVQFVVEWGLAGTLLFLSMIAWAFFTGLKQSMRQTDKNRLVISLSAGSMITALTLHGLFDGTYYHPQPSLYLAIGFAAWLRPLRLSE